MLKILVVDDEPRVRRGVSKLIEMYPEKYELMKCCSNAKEAVEALGTCVPDVIVTDIKMPDQDGLELIKHLKHRYYNLDFIILSGYGDFEYAKKALQYQVYDFLLKPLKAEDLYTALDGVMEKRKKNRVIRTESLDDNYFFNLIRSTDKEEEKKNLQALNLYGKESRYRVIVLDLENIPGTKKVPELLKNDGKKFFPNVQYIYSCFGYQLILVWEEELDRDSLERFLLDFSDYLCGKIYMGISNSFTSYTDIKDAYFEALNAVKQYIYDPEQTITYYNSLPDGKETAFPAELCDKIINAVKTGNTESMEKWMGQFWAYYKKKKCGILRLKRHLLLLTGDFEALAEELGMDTVYCNAIRDFTGNIEEIRAVSEIEEIWEKNLQAMTKEAGEIAGRRMNALYLDQILGYVQENYMNDISLDDVADHVNLSVGYLSNYFKGKMDMTFVDYLTQFRLEKAKDLLAHTNEKIYKIAEMVGYQNSQYFVTIFKRKIGVTPLEYRKYLTK